MVSLDFLEKVEAFKNLDDDQLKALQECSHVEEFQRGERLFRMGDDSKFLWIIKKGNLSLKLEEEVDSGQGETPISFISKAQAFGWSCFAPPFKYRLSGYCESRACKVVKIEKQHLIDLFEKDSQIGYQVMSYMIRVVGSHFHQYQDEIAKRIGESIMHQW